MGISYVIVSLAGHLISIVALMGLGNELAIIRNLLTSVLFYERIFIIHYRSLIGYLNNRVIGSLFWLFSVLVEPMNDDSTFDWSIVLVFG